MGFYKSYFVLFPTFKGIDNTKQFHGIMLLCWFLLLVVQPFLLARKQYKIHKALGKFSYVVVPFVMLSIFLVSREKFLRLAMTVSKEENIAVLALNIPSIFYFGLLFTLAMIYKKEAAYHIRFMIANALFVFGPGIGRALIIYGGVSFSDSVVYAILITEIIISGLLLTDLIKGFTYKPYLITLVFLISFQIIWAFRFSQVWQFVGGRFAELFF